MGVRAIGIAILNAILYFVSPAVLTMRRMGLSLRKVQEAKSLRSTVQKKPFRLTRRAMKVPQKISLHLWG